MLAGVAILYWGLGIFRGETSSAGGIVKRWMGPTPASWKSGGADDDAHSHDEPSGRTGGGMFRRT